MKNCNITKTFQDMSLSLSSNFERIVTEEHINLFSEISGDKNPLHLDEDFAKLCKSSKDDLAATTASSAKTWVKTKSQEAKIINNQCKDTIRQTYTLEDELQANRTASTDDGKAVLDAIAKIVADHSKLKDALVGD